MPQHPQVPFTTVTGREVMVDEGVFDLMSALKAHGVITMYSCQGEVKNRAYFVAEPKSMRALLRKINAAYEKGNLTKKSMRLVSNFRGGLNLVHISIYRRKNKVWREVWKVERARGFRLAEYRTEHIWHNNTGSRTVMRFPSNKINRFVKLLNELD